MIDDTETIDYRDKKALDAKVITSREYEAATRTVVRTLGGEADCDVIFVGTDACCGISKSGNHVVQLPSNPPEEMMTKKQYFISQGFANHETLHNRCTDLAGLAPRIEAIGKSGKHFTKALANCIEDMRIERAGKELYPGIQTKLDATAQFASEHFLALPRDKIDGLISDFKKIGPLAMTWEGRKRMGYNAPAIQQCLDLLPPDVLDKVRKYMDVAEKISTGVKRIGEINRDESFKASHHVVDMAEMIAAEVAEEGSSAGKGTKDRDDEGGSDKKGGDRDCSDEDGSDKFMDNDVANPDMLSWVANDLRVEWSKDKYIPETTALDVWVRKGDKTGAAKYSFEHDDNMGDYNKIMKAMTGKLAIMRRKLERGLMARVDTEYTSGHRAGKLDVRGKGVKIMSRMENVFRKREGGKDIDSAVTLLIDASGSMRGERIKLAQKSAIALAEAIARIGVPLEVLVFNTREPQADEVPNLNALRCAIQEARRAMEERAMKEKGSKFRRTLYARRQPISMYEVKEFDDNMQSARRGLGGIDKMVACANADGESLLLAWDRLKKRKEANKILIVLSDGEPACPTDVPALLDVHLRKAVEIITKEGGKCIGIGIATACVSKYYPRNTAVYNLNDLAGTTINNVARMLLGERFQVDNSKIVKTSYAA